MAIENSSIPWINQLWTIRNTLIIILTPILLSPLLICHPDSKAARCGYSLLIMIVFWVTEPVHMAVTSLLPIVLFPWLGILDSKIVCSNYMKDSNMLFFGGLILACGIEKWNLHRRIGLRVLMLVGSKPAWMVLGFMCVTAFLSMWLNNTAVASMMMPIAQAVLDEIDRNRAAEVNLYGVTVNSSDDLQPTSQKFMDKEPGETEEMEKLDAKTKGIVTEEKNKLDKTDSKSQVMVDRKTDEKEAMAFRKALKIGVPYAANIGGTATTIGTGPNIVLQGQLDALYNGVDTGITFSNWFVLAFPAMIVELLGSWILILLVFFGRKAFTFGKKNRMADKAVAQVIRNEYEKLGKMTFAESMVLASFITVTLLWFTKKPGFMKGWSDMLSHKYVTDACCGMTIAVLLFFLPAKVPNYLCFRRQTDSNPPEPSPAILDWPTVQKNMQWSVIVLLGGGFALADGFRESGLSTKIGNILKSFQYLQPWQMIVIICLMASIVTTFSSNISTTTIFVPVLSDLAISTCVNPLYLLLPATLASSWAFILPVSTPPNAIAYSSGDVEIFDMIKAGVVTCLFCNVILVFSILTYGSQIYDFNTFPKWADDDFSCRGNRTTQLLYV